MLNPDATAQYDQLAGAAVYTADGEKVGTVGQVFVHEAPVPENDRYYFRLNPGLLRKLTGDHAIFIPGRMVREVDYAERRVSLMISEERLHDAHWSQPPARLDLSVEVAGAD